ncbi:MAG: cytochrome bc complex cytochrome b subunit [Actinomycetota bacterium]
MLKGLARGIDERLGTGAFAQAALNKVFPDHWSFMLGEIAMYSFVVLLLTGIFLSFFFDPSVNETIYEGSYAPLRGAEISDAYNSTLRLSFDVRAGLVMRQTHHWAAVVFLAAIVAHLIRIFFTGAFRKPREINWIVGLTLLILAIFNGFTGYSLPDDLLSGTGLRIAHSIALSVPLIGTWAAFLIFGGEFPAEEIIPRLFVTHVMIVPAAIIGLLTIHLAIVWRQKHTDFPGPGRLETNVVGSRLWPTYTAKSVALFFAIAGVLFALGGLVQINPVWLYGPFVPHQVTSPAQPDWWLGFIEGALRLFPAWEVRAFGFEIPNPFFPAVLLPGLLFTLLFAWPFLEARFTRDHQPHHLLGLTRDHPVRAGLGVAALTFLTVLHFAASNDLLAIAFEVPVGRVTMIYRIALLVLPPLLGYLMYRLMKALALSGADRFVEMPWSALRLRAPLPTAAPAARAAARGGGPRSEAVPPPKGKKVPAKRVKEKDKSNESRKGR